MIGAIAVAAAISATPPIILWKKGDDGLTNRFFDQMQTRLGSSPDCKGYCLVVTLGHLQPTAQGDFLYGVDAEWRSTAEPGEKPTYFLDGRCPSENEILKCADETAAWVLKMTSAQ